MVVVFLVKSVVCIVCAEPTARIAWDLVYSRDVRNGIFALFLYFWKYHRLLLCTCVVYYVYPCVRPTSSYRNREKAVCRELWTKRVVRGAEYCVRTGTAVYPFSSLNSHDFFETAGPPLPDNGPSD